MTGWTGTDPVAWAMRQRDNVQNLLPRVVVAMAQLMARTIPEGGRLPIDTGNLRNSVTISATGRPNRGSGELTYSRQDFVSASQAVIGTGEAWIVWRAVYAHRMNYGFVGVDSLGRYYGSAQAVITTGYSNRAGYGFHEATMAQFPSVVSGVVKAMK